MEKDAMKPTERIAAQMRCSREFLNENCSRCKIHIPGGFPFQSFLLSDGKLALHTIFGMFQAAQLFADNSRPSDPNRSYMNMHTLLNEYLVFMGTMKLEIDQRIYATHTPKFPLVMEMSLRRIGKSSFSRTNIMFGPNQKFPYAKVSSTAILVDRISRKPVPFPESWRIKYTKTIPNDEHFIMKRLMRPKDAKISLRRIVFSDIDHQKHTAASVYFKFCFETFKEGVIKQWFKRLSNAVSLYGVKCFEILYIKESNFDDIVQIFVWEPDNIETGDLCFEIVTESYICIQAKMTFFRKPLHEVSDLNIVGSKL